MADQTHSFDIKDLIDTTDSVHYLNGLKKNDLGAKIYFNDGTYIKGYITKRDKYNVYLVHKNNIIFISKGNIKMIEPLADTEDKEKRSKTLKTG